ncbi:MAG: ATP/GTP-binding protein, partial [Actinomycetota bacterium]|nr:ATP/GTP-binding protein [Actinomycetota bacterium]
MPGPDVQDLLDGISDGKRAAVSRAITLVESTKPQHRDIARELLTKLPAARGEAADEHRTVRVGISGVPGVGKSTFIEALGSRLTANGLKVGVLAVDPSSVRTGGSVLGDKTRMQRLSVDP